MDVSQQFEVLKIPWKSKLLQFRLLKKGEFFPEKNSLSADWSRGDLPGDFLWASPPHRSEKEGGGGDCPKEESPIEI